MFDLTASSQAFLGRAVFHTQHGQQQVWNERCSLHTGRLPRGTSPPKIRASHTFYCQWICKAMEKPQNLMVCCKTPWNTEEADATCACSTCPNSRVGITPVCLSQGAPKENSLFVPRSNRPFRSSPQERRIPKNSCFCCFFLSTRHWVTLPYLLSRANTTLVQCDRLVPRAGDRGESQGFGLDSRDP